MTSPEEPGPAPGYAAEPAAWIDGYLWRCRSDALVTGAGDGPGTVTMSELLDGDAAFLRAAADRLQRAGLPPAVTAMYLAAWFAGGAATVVGFGLAVASCGLLPDVRQLRWTLTNDGLPIRTHIGTTGVVAAGHAWSGESSIEVVADDEVTSRSVQALVHACQPIVDACRRLARVGRVGLWNEVADCLGGALAHQCRAPVTEERLAALRRAVALPDAPWRSRPRIEQAHSPVLGPVPIVQKGGCCLAFTIASEPRRADDRGGTHGPGYCSTCRFRAPADCDRGQLSWLEQHFAPSARSPAV